MFSPAALSHVGGFIAGLYIMVSRGLLPMAHVAQKTRR